MSNHIHLLLEVIPAAPQGLTDAELLRRLRAIHSEAWVAEVAAELAEAREAVPAGRSDKSRVEAIHARFTYRMHDGRLYRPQLTSPRSVHAECRFLLRKRMIANVATATRAFG